MSQKPPAKPAGKPAPAPGAPKPKKKLSLEISEATEVLERKISP